MPADIQGWKWIFYVWGWLTGALNLTFWLMQVIFYFITDKGKPFFNDNFHKRVFWWGVFTATLWTVSLVAFWIMTALGY